MRNALHIRTTGFYCKACPIVVECAVGSLPGVAEVVAVRTMALTSVLYDPDVITPDELCSRIRSAGFGAEVEIASTDKEEEDDVTYSRPGGAGCH
ncbi:MAG: hypothetical protein ACYC6J_02235 [Coriobacteriia bacterium]